MDTTRAFTLIEVLLAVAVFAIVLAAINSVFFGALKLRNKTIQSFETALPLNHTLNLLQKDLEGIMLPGGRLAGNFTTSVQGSSNNNLSMMGERVTPDIYTASGNVGELARWADVQKVTYYLATPTNETTAPAGRDLVRLVTKNILAVNIDEPEKQWLMSGVETMHLLYFDGMSWLETWDGSANTNLPMGIKVQITLSEDYIGSRRTPLPIELVVPVVVRTAGTNSTEEAEGSGT